MTPAVFLLLSTLPRLSLSLSMTAPTILNISVPRHIMEGSEAVLTCNYRYHSQPYSVRWYKNGKEFYSFVADKAEPRAVHPTLGLTVDLQRSGSRSVSLTDVSGLTTGRFRCEVSGEAPMFATDTKYADLTVVTAPASGPLVTGARPSYHVRDPVSVTCSLQGSRPAANLTWYINNQQVSKKYLRTYPSQNLTTDIGTLETVSLGLDFRAERHLFRNRRRMKLKCVATIYNIYHKVNEISVEKIRRKHFQVTTDDSGDQSNLDHSEQPPPTGSPDHAPLHRQQQDKPVYLFNSASTVVAFNAFLTVAFILRVQLELLK